MAQQPLLNVPGGLTGEREEGQWLGGEKLLVDSL